MQTDQALRFLGEQPSTVGDSERGYRPLSAPMPSDRQSSAVHSDPWSHYDLRSEYRQDYRPVTYPVGNSSQQGDKGQGHSPQEHNPEKSNRQVGSSFSLDMLPPPRILPFPPERKPKPCSADTQPAASQETVSKTKPAKQTTRARKKPVSTARLSGAKSSESASRETKQAAEKTKDTRLIEALPAEKLTADSADKPRPLDPVKKTTKSKTAASKKPAAETSKSVPPRASQRKKSTATPSVPVHLKTPTVSQLSPPAPKVLAEASTQTSPCPLDKTTANAQNAPPQPTSLSQAADSSKPRFMVEPDEIIASMDTWIRRYHDLPMPVPPPAPESSLKDYLSRSDEERLKYIDGKILEYLQDENFPKLCEDMESSWRRLGLGF